ncbi:unnamed protein product [Miscanthus lutarioriparius]|uniref:rRNA N-glycosylase n=1 Tax=Miscanthus lutarioriparius TaxID=422564 RepID=A0A811MDY6_9POAL|nr:unnamed protein product [Miscanthus lutarioriparius]
MGKENDPAFTEELDVSRGSSYGWFISGVRNQLVLHAGATRHLELVLLQPQEEDPRKAPWFRVALRCSSSGDSVLLRVRADNLYISGYQSPDGRWWEFRGGSVIHAATQLAFTDSYESMGRAAGLELESVTLSKKDLEAAVGQLAAVGRRSNAGAGGSSQQDTARSLMVVAVMVCEVISAAHGRPGEELEQPVRVLARAALYGQKFLPLVGAAEGSQQLCDHIPRHLLAPVKIDCQDHAMMALGVALNRQRPLQDRHRKALDEHWRAVRAQARKLDRERT